MKSKADIDKLEAKKATLEVGANLEMDDFTVGEITLEVGMGNLNADGSITKIPISNVVWVTYTGFTGQKAISITTWNVQWVM